MTGIAQRCVAPWREWSPTAGERPPGRAVPVPVRVDVRRRTLPAFTGFARIPEVAEEGHRSVAALRSEDPVSLPVVAVSALAPAVGRALLGVAAARQVRQVVGARRECRRMSGDTEPAVVDVEAPQAFALPGAPGRIVVSRGCRAASATGNGRRCWRTNGPVSGAATTSSGTMWRLTAAADPLLRPLAEAGAFVVGRWADEEVAARVGSRAVVARAVGRAALATAGAARPAALAADGGAVPRRVRALPAPPPSRRALPFVAGALLPALCRGGLANAASDSESLVDGAERAQCAGDARAPYAAGTGHCRQRTDDACCDHLGADGHARHRR